MLGDLSEMTDEQLAKLRGGDAEPYNEEEHEKRGNLCNNGDQDLRSLKVMS